MAQNPPTHPEELPDCRARHGGADFRRPGDWEGPKRPKMTNPGAHENPCILPFLVATKIRRPQRRVRSSALRLFVPCSVVHRDEISIFFIEMKSLFTGGVRGPKLPPLRLPRSPSDPKKHCKNLRFLAFFGSWAVLAAPLAPPSPSPAHFPALDPDFGPQEGPKKPFWSSPVAFSGSSESRFGKVPDRRTVVVGLLGCWGSKAS